MDEMNIIRRFNFLNSRSSSRIESHKKIQEFLFYAESRFWAIFNHLTRTGNNRNGWCQKLLHRELILVLRYVGIGISLGHPLTVPILIRSLADSMGHLDDTELPIPIDDDFLSLLDSDLDEQNYVCSLVEKYECAWWIGRKPRNLDLADTMKWSSMGRCVEIHLNQLGESNSPPAHVLNSAIESLEKSESNDAKCPKCPQYKQILSDTLQDLLQVHRLTSTVLTGSEAKWHIDMRRASAFNLLHEAIVIKETGVTPSATSNRRNANDPDLVMETARQELARLQDQLPTSHKWTWGGSLSNAEVLSLRRSGSRPNIHSGYDLSLRDGNLHGEASPFPSHPDTSDHDQHITFEKYEPRHTLPEYKYPDIQYFRKGQNLIYDPLGKIDTTNPSLAPELSALSTENVEIHTKSMRYTRIPSLTANSWIEKNKSVIIQSRADIQGEAAEDIWSSAGNSVNDLDTGKGKQSLAIDRDDIWSSASDPGDETANAIETGKGKQSMAIDRDDIWSSASDPEDHSANAIETGKGKQSLAIDVDDMWSSASDQGRDETGPLPANDDIKFPYKVKDIEDMWSSGSEPRDNDVGPPIVNDCDNETLPLAKDVDNMWSSASDVDNAPLNGAPNDIGDTWSSASDADEDAENDGNIPTSQITVNSRLMVSPSRITIPSGNPHFPLSDVWPNLHSPLLIHTPELPRNDWPSSFRRFGPEDFTNLQDHMFEDRDSDSESSEE